MLPVFVPFAQAFAAAVTAALTGSLYYIATAPKGTLCFFFFLASFCILQEANSLVAFFFSLSSLWRSKGLISYPSFS
jgi:hypothetical protein